MTFSASWSGKGRDFPGLVGLVSPAVDTLSDAEAEHARHIGHLVEQFAAENAQRQVTSSVTGWVSGETNGASLSLSSSPVPTPAEPEPVTAVESAAEPELEGDLAATGESLPVCTCEPDALCGGPCDRPADSAPEAAQDELQGAAPIEAVSSDSEPAAAVSEPESAPEPISAESAPTTTTPSGVYQVDAPAPAVEAISPDEVRGQLGYAPTTFADESAPLPTPEGIYPEPQVDASDPSPAPLQDAGSEAASSGAPDPYAAVTYDSEIGHSPEPVESPDPTSTESATTTPDAPSTSEPPVV